MYGYGSSLSEASVLLTLANPADTMLSMAIGTISVSKRSGVFIFVKIKVCNCVCLAGDETYSLLFPVDLT